VTTPYEVALGLVSRVAVWEQLRLSCLLAKTLHREWRRQTWLTLGVDQMVGPSCIEVLTTCSHCNLLD
jgi:hypothetical protein